MQKISCLFIIILALSSCGGGGGGGISFFSSNNNNGFSVETISSGANNLFSNMWHLSNTGQTNFATNGGTNGEDINLVGVTQTGTGIIVAVVDDGLEITHEDLKDNVVVGGSYDFTDEDTNPTKAESKGHGTSVAGLIAASSNTFGVQGVAPNAKLKGFNALQNQSENNFINALGGSGSANSIDVDIFNQSYGYNYNFDFLISSTMETHYKNATENLRNSKGAIFVKAAGNGYKEFGSVICSSANYIKTTCQNSNMDPEASIPYNIVVGALNANGTKASYSTAGSSLWISAPGGEYGSTYPAMMTTDQSGCDRGYAVSSATTNSFENNTHISNPNPQCNYTSTFNGTSSAAPVLSGVVALMLEANPSLTWRDVKHILATTAKKVDSAITTTTVTIDGNNYDAEPAWLTNSAGYNFHNYYGFGRVDAARAVSSATSYVVGSLGAFTQTNWISSNVGLTIPDNSTTGITDTITISGPTQMGAVQIRVNATHTYTGELAVELTSPSGTKSVLFNMYNGFVSSNNLDMVLLSNAFYGENSNGVWTIKVLDGDTRSVGTRSFNSWQIRVFGR